MVGASRVGAMASGLEAKLRTFAANNGSEAVFPSLVSDLKDIHDCITMTTGRLSAQTSPQP